MLKINLTIFSIAHRDVAVNSPPIENGNGLPLLKLVTELQKEQHGTIDASHPPSNHYKMALSRRVREVRVATFGEDVKTLADELRTSVRT
jgi:hypothetical protein